MYLTDHILHICVQDDVEKSKMKETKDEFKDLTKWWKNLLTTEEVRDI